MHVSSKTHLFKLLLMLSYWALRRKHYLPSSWAHRGSRLVTIALIDMGESNKQGSLPATIDCEIIGIQTRGLLAIGWTRFCWEPMLHFWPKNVHNKIWPRMELWGTPQVNSSWGRDYSTTILNKKWTNHFRAIAWMGTQLLRGLRRIVWVTVSKAAWRSDRIETARFTESAVKSKLYHTVWRADFVLCCALKPDQLKI